jgi:molecular chaperone GrpE
MEEEVKRETAAENPQNGTPVDAPGGETAEKAAPDLAAALAAAIEGEAAAEKRAMTLQNEKEAAESKLSLVISQQVRLQQDFDNFRTRSRKEQAEAKDKVTAEVAASFLPVVDNCERALAHMEKDPAGAAYTEGFELLHRQLLKVLADLGVEEIAAQGETFDPHVHEAVMQIPSPDLPDETVGAVFQKGYRLKEIILRPAKVQVVNNG